MLSAEGQVPDELEQGHCSGGETVIWLNSDYRELGGLPGMERDMSGVSL